MDNEFVNKLLKKRYSIRPLNPKYKFAWDAYKSQIAAMWTVDEVDLSKDLDDYEKLTKNERKVVEFILAFFAGSDGIVNVNIGENLINDFGESVGALEIVTAYRFQAMMEDIHNDMYSLLIDVLIKDPEQKLKLFEGIEQMPIIQEKARWAMQYMGENVNKVERLVAFACVEGIQFSSSFCYFYWLKNRNLMPGLTLSNEFISRDEGNHFKFAVEVYHHLEEPLDTSLDTSFDPNESEKYEKSNESNESKKSKALCKITNEKLREIIKDSAELEMKFVDTMIPEPLYNMNAKLMKQYVKYVADYVCSCFKIPKIYKVKQPFEFMETISLEQKTNFFESRNSVYSKAVSGNDAFAMDDEF